MHPRGHGDPGRPHGERPGCRHRQRDADRARAGSGREPRQGTAGVHVPARGGRAVAVAVRREEQPGGDQQRSPGLPVRGAEARAQAALHLPPVLEGARARQLPRLRQRRPPRAHDRAVHVHGGTPEVAPARPSSRPAPRRRTSDDTDASGGGIRLVSRCPSCMSRWLPPGGSFTTYPANERCPRLPVRPS